MSRYSKSTIFLVFLLAGLIAFAFADQSPKEESLLARFKKSVRESKIYVASREIYNNLKAVFKRNLDKVRAWNSQSSRRGGAVLSLDGPFAATSDIKYAKLFGLSAEEALRKPVRRGKRGIEEIAKAKPKSQSANAVTAAPSKKYPSSVDWRNDGRVFWTPYDFDQTGCGACWSFAIIAMMEARIAIMKQVAAEKLSEQYFLNCAYAAGISKGKNICLGQNVAVALKWLETAPQLAYGRAVPYWGIIQTCAPVAAEDVVKLQVRGGHVRVPADADAIAAHVAQNGPVVVTLNAFGDLWQLYKEGVILAKDCPPLIPGSGRNYAHAVVIVGYTTKEVDGKRTPVWIVKNSWGNKWGDNGYAYIERGPNTCGINSVVDAFDFTL